MAEHIAFIGGGNMASAIISGLLSQGFPAAHIDVVEPFAEAQERLQSQFGITAQPQGSEALLQAPVVIWAVKPQTFEEAAQQIRSFTPGALHLSVAAGIRSDSIGRWLGTQRVIRTMPNTPALIGQGITALYARRGVTEEDRRKAEYIIATTGEHLWLDKESQLDAVTALSGSGPAYMFYFMEAMITAGIDMGLSRAQAHQLTVATFSGAGALAKASTEPPEVLRQRVTSKGGTTYAAITDMDGRGVQQHFIHALFAAQQRAQVMGDEFGANSN